MTKYNTQIVLAYFKERGLPEPVMEYKFLPDRKYRADFAWPDFRLLLEVEGGVFNSKAHGSVTGILRDMEKYTLAAVHGYRVLRVLPNDLCRNTTVALIKGALKWRSVEV